MRCVSGNVDINYLVVNMWLLLLFCSFLKFFEHKTLEFKTWSVWQMTEFLVKQRVFKQIETWEYTVFENHRKSLIQVSTLRAKQATFPFWVDKSWIKMPKMIHFGQFLKTWSLRSNSVTRRVNFNRKLCKIQ